MNDPIFTSADKLAEIKRLQGMVDRFEKRLSSGEITPYEHMVAVFHILARIQDVSRIQVNDQNSKIILQTLQED